MKQNSVIWAILPDALDEHIKTIELETEKSLNASELPRSERKSSSDIYSIENHTAIISIDSPLGKESSFGYFTGRRYILGYNDIRSAIIRAEQDILVNNIILNIDSPGGIVSGCKELADCISNLSKPCIAYTGGTCASAAFWLASATGKIFATRTATIGSIGVLMTHVDYSKFYDKSGIKITYITGGKYKAIGNQENPLSEEDKTYLESRVNSIHEVFREDVARYMNLDLNDADKWGDGQVFIDREASRSGLVTNIVSDIHEAMNYLSKETAMTKDELAAQYPDLLREIQTEAVKQEKESLEMAIKDAKASVLALISSIAGEDVRRKIEAVMSAGLTSEQVNVVASILSPESASAQSAKSQILKNILSATQEALPNQARTETDDTRAAIERMSRL